MILKMFSNVEFFIINKVFIWAVVIMNIYMILEFSFSEEFYGIDFIVK